MKSKMQTFFKLFKIIFILILVIGGCGLRSYFVWQALGTTIQQVIIGALAIGLVWNCVVPFLGLLILFVILFIIFRLVEYIQTY